jgi:hypothetical protein
MGQAADALETWCHDLGDLQTQAKDLEQRAEAAARAAEEARANPDFALADRTFTDQQSLQIAQKLLDNAGQRLRDAIDGCTNVQDAAKQLLEQHTQIAQRVAELLRKAKDLAPDEPDVLDKVVDAVSGALGDLSDSLSDAVDDVWNAVQDNAELIAKVSDVLGDIGNGLGVVSDFIPKPVGPIVAAVATGLGIGALAGHATAKAAGADVAPEVLTFDALGAASSLLGVFAGSETEAKIITRGGYALLAEQGAGELASGDSFESPWDDIKNYWIPKDGSQWAQAGASVFAGPELWAGVAMQNAADAGIKADNAPERRRERMEDEAWS